MKKYVIMAVIMAGVVIAAPQAEAAGKHYGYFGEVSETKVRVGDYVDMSDVPKTPENPVRKTVGNNSILDMAKRLMVQDVPEFLEMVRRAGIRF